MFLASKTYADINSWQKQYATLMKILNDAQDQYQQDKVTDSHLTIMKAYFDIFESMEIPLRHKFGNEIVFTMEGYFAELREITSNKHKTTIGLVKFSETIKTIKNTLEQKIKIL